MKALITGASSGIGYQMAKYLSDLGHDLVLVARNKEKLQKIQEELKTDVKIVVADLSNENKVKEVYVLCKNEDIDILINNAGFGDCGHFYETDLNKEMEMIDLNIKAVHILTKLFFRDMKKKNKGYILNVASSAAFLPGPLMATYYSTKAYVLRLTTALHEELRREKLDVSVSCLCPGPVDTNFNKVANVKFSVKPLDGDFVARYAIDKMFNKKLIIIPGFKMKYANFFSRFCSTKLLAKITYNIQKKKIVKRGI
ncbi:MAG: SDR family oxidoreductase [Bacilli bacterium]|nr:SDR family oxidoreductase [Bacilli bacterium]